MQVGGKYLAAISMFSFPEMLECPGIHIKKTGAADWDKEWHNIWIRWTIGLVEYIFWRETSELNESENKRIEKWRGVWEESADRQR